MSEIYDRQWLRGRRQKPWGYRFVLMRGGPAGGTRETHCGSVFVLLAPPPPGKEVGGGARV